MECLVRCWGVVGDGMDEGPHHLLMTRGEGELQGGTLWEVHVERYPQAARRWERSPIPVADAVALRCTARFIDPAEMCDG
jgi:hypothetical protein